MATVTNAQALAVYLRCDAGRCALIANGCLVYEAVKSGHTFSSALNFWVGDAALELRVEFVPAERVTQCASPELELFIHEGARDIGLIVQSPTPTMPKEVKIDRRSDQSIERVVVLYSIALLRPPFRDWILRPLPWASSAVDSAPDAVFDLFMSIQAAFVASDAEEVAKLAESRIKFCSTKLQIAELELRARFVNDVKGVMSSGAQIEACTEPRVQLRLFPVVKGLVYRIDWASGMSAIHTLPSQDGFQQGFQIFAAKVGAQWVWIV